MWEKVWITIAFLVIPVLWGVAVNGVFDLWQGRDEEGTDDDGVFPDYQI